MTGVLRRYEATDRAAVAEICLRTGAAGGDARGLYADAGLLADVYALPYVDLEPATASVVVQPDDGALAGDRAPADDEDAVLRVRDGVLVGYVLAAPDTAAFVERWRREWTPGFLSRHPEPLPARGGPAYTEAQLWHDGVHPERMLDVAPEVLAACPAHLHIDLLPRAQGQGWGRRLIEALCQDLAARDVPGIHLGYAAANTAAGAFYARLGFRPLAGHTPRAPLVGRRTTV